MRTNREIRVARLKWDSIGEYRHLHDHIPEQNVKHIIQAGYTELQIFLLDDLLIMLTELDPSQALPDRVIDEQVEKEWHEKTGRCFESEWQQVDTIFDLQQLLNKG
ncbi:L-rhamnose mutarotase [Cohnella abietis]|uniref:L-rhamnose mutarotase n=1 Tax=Cohnella abietis TaxID=2507935 RepID=A0A3T1D3N5_9BACL|nr:L-rhamnose mutarotase [Cohnella abietis]BBI32717.1 hypothetical protein KCTCHS21_21160 [Cohnella abietis]